MDFDVTALSADFRAGLKEMETDYGFSTDGAIKLSAEPARRDSAAPPAGTGSPIAESASSTANFCAF